MRTQTLLMLSIWLMAPALTSAQPTTLAPPSGLGRISRLAKRVEPDLQGTPERLAQYVDFYRSNLANDTRLFAFDVKAHVKEDGRVLLTGYVEFPETLSGLQSLLKVLGFDDVESQARNSPC